MELFGLFVMEIIANRNFSIEKEIYRFEILVTFILFMEFGHVYSL